MMMGVASTWPASSSARSLNIAQGSATANPLDNQVFESDVEEDYPLPPEHLREPGFEVEPAPEVADWLFKHFILEGAPLVNPDHEHLRKVDLVAMWTNVEYFEGGMQVVGQAEIVNPTGKPWGRADKVDRLCMLHGNIPQARVWLYAPTWAERGYWRACAVGEHELYHYAHKKSKEGELQHDDLERPVLASRAHDVEEHLGIMVRYGVDYCAGRSREFIEAALKTPIFAPPTFAVEPAACACGARI